MTGPAHDPGGGVGDPGDATPGTGSGAEGVRDQGAGPVTPHAWTLDELAARAEESLAQLGLLDVATDGRVAKVADPRTVRYYQSLGLLDKPSSYAGQKARYGERHRLQLVLVKALQRLRLPLAEIQARLYAKTDAELEALLASVPRPRHDPGVRVSHVREIVLAPGLKLSADAGWSFRGDPERLVSLFKSALAALATPEPGDSE